MIYGRFIGSLSFVLVLVLTYGPIGAFYTISSVFVCFLMNTFLYEKEEINNVIVSGDQLRNDNNRLRTYYH